MPQKLSHGYSCARSSNNNNNNKGKGKGMGMGRLPSKTSLIIACAFLSTIIHALNSGKHKAWHFGAGTHGPSTLNTRIVGASMARMPLSGSVLPSNMQESNLLAANTAVKDVREMYRRAQALERSGKVVDARKVYQLCVEGNPQDGHSWLALGKLEQHSGKKDAARQAFKTGLKYCPGNVHLYHAWGVLEDRCRNVQKARDCFVQAYELEPTNAHVCHAWGTMEQRLGNLDKARQMFNVVMKERPQATVCVALAELEKQCGNIEQAERVLQHGLQKVKYDRQRILLYYAFLEERVMRNLVEAEKLLAEAVLIAPQSVKVHVARANLAQRGGRIEEARAILNATRTMPANDGQHYNTWATLETQQNRLDVAVEILAEGHKKFPADQFLLQRWGTIEVKRGNLTAARELYEKSVAVKPHAATFVSWAILEEELGRQRLLKAGAVFDRRSVTNFLQELSAADDPGAGAAHVMSDEDDSFIDQSTLTTDTSDAHAQAVAFAEVKFALARQLYEKGIKADPRHGPLYNSYGKIEARLNNINRAREIYFQGIAANCTESASVYHGWGVLELNQGNYERARELLTQGIEAGWRRDKGDVSFLLHSLGMLELDKHNLTRAMEVFRMGVERYPNNSPLNLGAAMTCVQLGLVNEARSFFRISVEADRRHAHAWQAWALMEKRECNVEVSRALFTEGLKNCPTHAALYQGLAVLEIEEGNFQLARELFANALSKCPAHAQSLQAWACLEVRLGNLERARVLAKEGLRRRPNHAALWTVYGLIVQREGETNRARKIFQEAIQRFPSHGVLYRVLGELEDLEGNYLKARDAFQRGLQADPYHAQLYHSLAMLEAKLGNLGGLSQLHQQAKEFFNPDPVKRGGRVNRGEEDDDVISRIRQLQMYAIEGVGVGAGRKGRASDDEDLIGIDVP